MMGIFGRSSVLSTLRLRTTHLPEFVRAVAGQKLHITQKRFLGPYQFSEAAKQARKRLFFEHLTKKGSGPLNALAMRLHPLDSSAVFANADTPLNRIDTYGFDYDYTLASYNQNIHELIYTQAQQYLFNRKGYPERILGGQFDPSFAIRGLHYDTNTGFLMKVDQFNKIQPESVYRGRSQVDIDELQATYKGFRMSNSYVNSSCHMYKDLFCLPEMCLLADVTEACIDHKLNHAPQYLFQDIRDAIEYVHGSGVLHKAIMENPAKYIDANPYLAEYLHLLRKAGKKMFLLTNSSYKFVDAGMRFLLADYLKVQNISWPEMFDVVITNAKKPYFYEGTLTGPPKGFRKIDTVTGLMTLEQVEQLRRGEVYSEGGLSEFERLSDFDFGPNVLYMGDQIYSDLVTPNELAMWKTAAIIREIQHETESMSSPLYRSKLAQLLEIEALIQHGQLVEDAEARKQVEALKIERKEIRAVLKEVINPYFGSVFRTYNSRTMFFYNVARYADVYTCNINNFLRYSLEHCFYANRSYFPHELPFPDVEALHELDKMAQEKYSKSESPPPVRGPQQDESHEYWG